jgi:hypothetical protein
MQVGTESGQATGGVVGQPAVDRIRVPRPQQTLTGHGMGAHALRDLHEGGTAFPHLGMRIVIPDGDQCFPFLGGELQGATADHGRDSFL